VIAMLGEYSREIIVEPGAQTTVTGQLPPILRSWWPWVVAALVVGGYVYLTREDGRAAALSTTGSATDEPAPQPTADRARRGPVLGSALGGSPRAGGPWCAGLTQARR
jgi:hypothetical protein